MKKQIKIAGKIIEEYGDVFTIAEAGVNHNGKLKNCFALIDVAVEAGADAIKFQTFKAHEVVTKEAEMAHYQIKNTGEDITQMAMLKKYELDEAFYQPIIARCREKDILFISTPHGGLPSVDFLESLNVKAYKVGSGDVTNYLMLKKLAHIGKPIILSTGMATLQEVNETVQFLKDNNNDQIILLHCTTDYPCSFDDVNLDAMQTMMGEFSSIPVGYSDHTVGTQVAIMSTTMGACMYECHFTLNKNLPGPDHVASANPHELKMKIQAIRNVKKIRGLQQKRPTKQEDAMRMLVRKSIVFTRDLPKGTVISESDLEAKRPASGVSPSLFKKIVGRELKKSVKKDEQIQFDDLL